MKFAALALTLLLAVGSYAEEQHAQLVKDKLGEIRNMFVRIADGLKNTAYEDQIPEINARVGAYFDIISGILDSDTGREKVNTAITLVQGAITRWQDSELRSTLLARFNDYKTIFENFYTNNEQAFSGLRENIVQTIKANHEETGRVLKEALVTAHAEVQGHVESLREVARGQTEELTEHMKRVVGQLQESNLRQVIETNGEVIRQKLEEIYAAFITAINPQ